MPINPSINSPLAQGASQQTFGDWSRFRQFGSAVRQGANVAGNYAIQQQRAKEQKDYTLRSAYATRDFNTVYNEAKISGEPVSPEWLEQKVDEYLETNEKLRSHFDTYPDHRDTIRESLLSRFSDDAFQFQHQQDVARQEMEYQEEVHGLLEPFRQKPSITPEDWNLLKTDALALRDMATLSPQAKEAHAKHWDRELLALSSKSSDIDVLNDILSHVRTVDPVVVENARNHARSVIETRQQKELVAWGTQIGNEEIFGSDLEDDPGLQKPYTYAEAQRRLSRFVEANNLDPENEAHNKIIRNLQAKVDARRDWTPDQYLFANNPTLAQEYSENPESGFRRALGLLQQLQESGNIPKSVDIVQFAYPTIIAEQDLAEFEQLVETPGEFFLKLSGMEAAYGGSFPWVIESLQKHSKDKPNGLLSFFLYSRKENPIHPTMVEAYKSDLEMLKKKVQGIGETWESFYSDVIKHPAVNNFYEYRRLENGGTYNSSMSAELDLLVRTAAHMVSQGKSINQSIKDTLQSTILDNWKFMALDDGSNVTLSRDVVKSVGIMDFLEQLYFDLTNSVIAKQLGIQPSENETRWSEEASFWLDRSLNKALNESRDFFVGDLPRSNYDYMAQKYDQNLNKIIPFRQRVRNFFGSGDSDSRKWHGPTITSLGLQVPDAYFPEGLSDAEREKASHLIAAQGRFAPAKVDNDNPNDQYFYWVIPAKEWDADSEQWVTPTDLNKQGIKEMPMVGADGQPVAISFRELMVAWRAYNYIGDLERAFGAKARPYASKEEEEAAKSSPQFPITTPYDFK